MIFNKKKSFNSLINIIIKLLVQLDELVRLIPETCHGNFAQA